MARIIKYMHYEVWDEITYTVTNLKVKPLEFGEWISNATFCWACDY